MNDLITELVAQGVSAFVVCSGSRNLSLIEAISEDPTLTVFHHFEEREASFFALGLIKRSKKSVCVVTTSGTAVAEALPAIIEAHYSGLPLIVLSADRPVRFRGTGAPQSIEQRDIFNPYCAQSFDITDGDTASVKIDSLGPTHINICLEERQTKQTTSKPRNILQPVKKSDDSYPEASKKDVETVTRFIKESTRPLMMVGEISEELRKVVSAFAIKLKIPLFAECLSGLRELPELSPLLLKSGERVLHRGNFDAVLRIGSVPTARFWRDLEEKEIKTLSIDAKPFSGTPHGKIIQCDLYSLLMSLCNESFNEYQKDEILYKLDERSVKMIHELFYQFPHAEPSLFHTISHRIHEHDYIYLGNSLPIREWELAATRKTPHKIIGANRGANGIDGQLSTFFGSLDPLRHNFGIFGDLTTLYGLSAPYILSQCGDVQLSLLIINNSGGKIFSRVKSLQDSMSNPLIRSRLINEHAYSFASLAAMWGLQYVSVDGSVPELRVREKTLFEFKPSDAETVSFWQKYDSYWESL